MVGFGAPRRTGRLPPFLLVALLAVIGLLAFNYWSVSARQAALHDELLALQAQVQRTEVARSRLEKRNSELLSQADNQQRQIDQKQGEYQSMSKRLQALDMKAQHCELDRLGLKTNVSHQMEDISRLKEMLNELRMEFTRKEDQLHVYQNNITTLQKMLSEESQRCRQQVADQKREYEESIRKLQQGEKGDDVQPSSKEATGAADVENKPQSAVVGQNEDKKEDFSNNRLTYGKDAAKVGSDAGMPEIEDSDPAKDNPFPTGVKKLDIVALPNADAEQVYEKRPSVQPNSYTEADANRRLSAAKKDSVHPLGMDNVLHLKPLSPKQIPGDQKAMAFPNLKQKDDDRDGQGDAAEYQKDRFGDTL
ncbi:protein GOLM2 isoform 2-T2 [Discoglossus pictus]